jgi:hypothetical protein
LQKGLYCIHSHVQPIVDENLRLKAHCNDILALPFGDGL